MDDIINNFISLSFNSNNFSVDTLINKISNIEVRCAHTEWHKFQENYFKLRQLQSVLLIPELKKPFELFMDKISEINQQYILHINLEPESECYSNEREFKTLSTQSVKTFIQKISDSLHMSINTNDYKQKYDCTIDAYSHMLSIIEDSTDLKPEYIPDPHFDEQFNVKRRKLN